jgi:hypothetical protein
MATCIKHKNSGTGGTGQNNNSLFSKFAGQAGQGKNVKPFYLNQAIDINETGRDRRDRLLSLFPVYGKCHNIIYKGREGKQTCPNSCFATQLFAIQQFMFFLIPCLISQVTCPAHFPLKFQQQGVL